MLVPIDISTLEGRITSLESSLRVVGVRLGMATFAVVLGLVIEYWDDGRSALPALWRVMRHRRLSYWRALERHVKFAFVGGILVTLGVAGELWYEHRTRIADAALQVASGQIVASLNEKASGAIARAAALENENLRLQGTVASLMKEAETARGNAATAIARAAEIEIQERATRRAVLLRGTRSTVITEDYQSLTDALRSLGPHKAEVRYEPNIGFPEANFEVVQTAMLLAQAFGDANWSCPPIAMKSNVRGHGIMVTVGRDAPPESRLAAVAVNRFLNELPMRSGLYPNVEPMRPEQTLPSVIHVGDPTYNLVLPPVTPDLIVVTVLQHP